jgi:hypothetical protein
MFFLKTPTGKIIIAIIWGLGLSTLFCKSCEYGEKCEIIEYRGPPAKLHNKLWNYGDPNKCYSLTTKVVKCSNNAIQQLNPK